MSSKYRCPRCEYDRDCNAAPLGKVLNSRWIINIINAINELDPKWIDCKACNGTGFIPAVVIAGIKKSFPNVTEIALSTLKWDMDHFYFIRLGIYTGVELSGECHQ